MKTKIKKNLQDYTALILAILEDNYLDSYSGSVMVAKDKFEKNLKRMEQDVSSQLPSLELELVDGGYHRVKVIWPKMSREEATKLLNTPKKFTIAELIEIQNAINSDDKPTLPVPPINPMPPIRKDDWESSDWESYDWESSSC